MSWRARLRMLWTTGRGVVRGLPEATADRDPLELFTEWLDAARECGVALPQAMSLSTVSPGGEPSSRMVILNGHGPEGFVFFTSYASAKATDIDENDRVALLLWWAVLERQVRIEGRAEHTSDATSAEYFRSRPRRYRIAAWASPQSEPMAGREELEERMRATEERFPGDDIPVPPHWGGFRVVPHRMEFWQGRADHRHDRLVFERDHEGAPWITTRLCP